MVAQADRCADGRKTVGRSESEGRPAVHRRSFAKIWRTLIFKYERICITYSFHFQLDLPFFAGGVAVRRSSAGVRGDARGRVRLRVGRVGAEHQHPAHAAARRQDGPPQPQHAPGDAPPHVPEQHPQRWAVGHDLGGHSQVMSAERGGEGELPQFLRSKGCCLISTATFKTANDVLGNLLHNRKNSLQIGCTTPLTFE